MDYPFEPHPLQHFCSLNARINDADDDYNSTIDIFRYLNIFSSSPVEQKLHQRQRQCKHEHVAQKKQGQCCHNMSKRTALLASQSRVRQKIQHARSKFEFGKCSMYSMQLSDVLTRFIRRRRVALPIAICSLAWALLCVPDGTDGTRRRLLSMQPPKRLGSSSSTGQPLENQRLPTQAVLFDDGTLFVPSTDSICDYLINPHRRHTEIQRIHLHLSSCEVETEKLQEHFSAQLLAQAYQVPFGMTCGSQPQDTSGNLPSWMLPGGHLALDETDNIPNLSLLSTDFYIPPGSLPTDLKGKHYKADQICSSASSKASQIEDFDHNHNADLKPRADLLFLQSEPIRQSIPLLATEWLVKGEGHDDIVIYLSAAEDALGDETNGILMPQHGLVPHAAYSDLVRQISETSSNNKVQSISIVLQQRAPSVTKNHHSSEYDAGKMPAHFLRRESQNLQDRYQLFAKDLVSYMMEEFPETKVRLRTKEPLPVVYSRLLHAKKGSVCGLSSTCAFPVVSRKDSLGLVYQSPATSSSSNNSNSSSSVGWPIHMADYHLDTRTWSAPELAASLIPHLSDDVILHWMRHQDPRVGSLLIDSQPLLRG